MLLLCRNLGYILKTSLHVSRVDYVTDHNPNQEIEKNYTATIYVFSGY